MTNKTPPGSEVVIRVSYQSDCGPGRGAVFETYMPQSSSVAELSSIMDKLRVVCDRQQAFTRIVELERVIKSDKAALEALVADREQVVAAQMQAWEDGGRRGPFKLDKSQVQHKQNIDGSIANRLKSIEMITAQLEEARAIIGD